MPLIKPYTEQEAIWLESELNKGIARVKKARDGLSVTYLYTKDLQIKEARREIIDAYNHLTQARLCLDRAKKKGQDYD